MLRALIGEICRGFIRLIGCDAPQPIARTENILVRNRT